MSASRYPELDRLNAVAKDKQLLDEFVEFLERKGAIEPDESHDDLVLRFFDLDPEQIRAERTALIDSL